MKRMIWIPDDDIEGIKAAAYQEHKSVSQYLVDLHKRKIGVITAGEISQGLDNVINYKPPELSGIDKIVKQRGVDSLKNKEMPKVKYSDEYRKKNPMERCRVCGKALNMNCGH